MSAIALNYISNSYISSKIHSIQLPSLFLPVQPVGLNPKSRPAHPSVPQGNAKANVKLVAPNKLLHQNLTWDGIRQGRVIGLFAEGHVVKELQGKLTAAGFPVAKTGVLGPTTQKLLKKVSKTISGSPDRPIGSNHTQCF